MAGVQMRGGAELDRLIRQMKLARSPEFKKRLLKQLSHEGHHQVLNSFQTQTDPYGAAWKPLKNPSAHRMGGMILSDTGRLRNSFRVSNTDTTFTIASRVVYAATHQYGRDAIPARPYLPENGRLGPRWTRSFTEISQAVMARELKRGG